MLNILPLACVILVANFFSLFPILKLSDFVLLNYLATTFLNLVSVFSLKVAKWLFFFRFRALQTQLYEQEDDAAMGIILSAVIISSWMKCLRNLQ